MREGDRPQVGGVFAGGFGVGGGGGRGQDSRPDRFHPLLLPEDVPLPRRPDRQTAKLQYLPEQRQLMIFNENYSYTIDLLTPLH